jgi:flagellar motor protein MotB
LSPATHSQAPSLVSIAEQAVRHGELGLTRRVEWIGCHQRRRDLDRALQQNSALKLHMVGHTDNVGQLPANLDLSHRRADAVVKILSTKYSIAAARLDAQGIGPLAPVASNDGEAGRARNRRVELVKQ